MEEIITPKRRLGTGMWDKRLIQNMTNLSVSNNYEEASKEWIATGRVWWAGLSTIPDWVSNTGHVKECLCGHRIVYHFEIENQENGRKECVGSDHISTYMIIKQIAQSQNRNIDDISDEEIQTWLNVRVESMKKTAWWEVNGELFTQMFDAIKEYDVRINVRGRDIEWDFFKNCFTAKYTLRKGSKGEYGTPEYRMASIVWRWNHPDNAKNQRDTRGYPTEKLYNDLVLFYATMSQWKEKIEIEDEKLLSLTIRQRQTQDEVQHGFEEGCESYGIIAFDIADYDSKIHGFLTDMKVLLSQNKELTDRQMQGLFNIIRSNMMTEKQRDYLKNLGLGDKELRERFGIHFSQISKKRASKLIEERISEREGGAYILGDNGENTGDIND